MIRSELQFNLNLNFANPQCRDLAPDWKLCLDSMLGERRIKECGELYLPMTEGQLADHAFGRKRYEAYKERACYFPYFSNTVFSMMGLLHRERPEAVELPHRIEKMITCFSSDGASLHETLRRINFMQLAVGRCGLLLDVPSGEESADAVPVVSIFPAQRILDWVTDRFGKLRFLLLDETREVFDPSLKKRFPFQMFRICMLNANGEYCTFPLSPKEYASFNIEEEPPENSSPQINGRPMKEIPFVFVNSSDTGSAIHPPPLLAMADIAMAIYRGEADYRHALFMQGQATLFLKGFPLETPPMMGAGNYIHTDSAEADGRFLEVSGSGLAEMRHALEDLHTRASDLGLSLGNISSRESGEALKTRLAVKTALLRSIAVTGEAAINSILRMAAEWCVCDPEKVVFLANKDFSDSGASAEEAVQLLNAKKAGMPLSDRAIHDWLRKNDFTDFSYEEDISEIKKEKQ